MNIRKFIFIALTSVSLLTSNVSRAAFPVKKDANKTEAISESPKTLDAIVTDPAAIPGSETVVNATSIKAEKKHSFVSKIVSKIVKMRKAAAIPQVAYIILSIFMLGWLAIGLNENFEGINWLIALLLYLLFWLPGFIYSLIMMGNYY